MDKRDKAKKRAKAAGAEEKPEIKLKKYAGEDQKNAEENKDEPLEFEDEFEDEYGTTFTFAYPSSYR